MHYSGYHETEERKVQKHVKIIYHGHKEKFRVMYIL